MATWLDELSKISKQKKRMVAGLMSGTSADSVDVALCEIEGGGLPSGEGPGAKVRLAHFYEHPYDPALRKKIADISGLNVRQIAELNVQLGKLFAQAFNAATAEARLKNSQMDLIGSHGQTVYHHSRVPGALKATLQLADGDHIASATGLPVVFDFRQKDMAVGGQGAPLTPYADLVLLGPKNGEKILRRAILNLGGIANITVLDADPGKVMGFDTGPANAPLDRLAKIISGGTQLHDLDGAFAKAGKINEELLAKLLLEDKYLKSKPPKSTGFEMYGDKFVDKVIAMHGQADINLMATLTQFVAESVAGAINNFLNLDPALDELIVAGGGGQNPELMRRIRAALPQLKVRVSDELGVPSKAREAMAFALFANDTLLGLPISLPSVTGASRACISGKIALP